MRLIKFHHPSLLKLWLLALLLLLASGCGAAYRNERVRSPELPMAPLQEMPDYVRAAEPRIQQAYRFAAANPEALQHIPCYCGCNGLGHKNNLACYIMPSGQYDQHAAYCTICIDITHDVMQMTQMGRNPAVIRAFVDNKYRQYGPSTETGPVPYPNLP